MQPISVNRILELRKRKIARLKRTKPLSRSEQKAELLLSIFEYINDSLKAAFAKVSNDSAAEHRLKFEIWLENIKKAARGIVTLEIMDEVLNGYRERGWVVSGRGIATRGTRVYTFQIP